MPLVKHYAEGETYELQPGEHLLQLQSTAEVPLHVGIRKGEYMIAYPAAEPMVTYVLTDEQAVRLQQQVQTQVTYRNWLKDGILTVVDMTEPPLLARWLPKSAPPEARDDRPTWR